MKPILYRGLRLLGVKTFVDTMAQRDEVRSALAEVRRKVNVPGIIKDALERAVDGTPTATEKEAWDKIEKRRSELATSLELVDDVDYGAGNPRNPNSKEESRRGVVTKLHVREYVSFSKSALHAQLLFYIARRSQPASALELGTCLGISASYIAFALRLNGKGHLVTIEGSPPAARLSRETFAALNLNEYVTAVIGPFHETLDTCLIKYGPFGYVFVDGHHDGDATVRYFRQIKPHLSYGSVVIFDDITWNVDMTATWNDICRDPAVSDFVCVGGMGIVVVK